MPTQGNSNHFYHSYVMVIAHISRMSNLFLPNLLQYNHSALPEGDIKYNHCFFLFDWISHRDIDLFSFCLILVHKRKYHVVCSNCKNYLPQMKCLLALKLFASVALYHFVVIDNECWSKSCSGFIISG